MFFGVIFAGFVRGFENVSRWTGGCGGGSLKRISQDTYE